MPSHERYINSVNHLSLYIRVFKFSETNPPKLAAGILGLNDTNTNNTFIFDNDHQSDLDHKQM